MKPNLCFILDKITTVFINSRNIENFIENLHFKENRRGSGLYSVLSAKRRRYISSGEKEFVWYTAKMTDTDLEDMKVLFICVSFFTFMELEGNISLDGYWW